MYEKRLTHMYVKRPMKARVDIYTKRDPKL